ncbi:alpha/beta fold hydrolase [Parvibaculum sp.]|uniref:alpha/beta fold hydrolase n=1 Tax=Parvibaculum sp. TaxID=2024848 RepID=UPI002718474F|nr:alpha/beta fold hydrolase [Parvibaculum sp.]MDO9127503.1 alpha/beta fold hydrolase [Parvibaculum sp.]MDP1627703.1 alpha/beta fold hydrolase [Parvibaculum sp.]MDP2150701.1 alpha/beta fold hydrolase [Parvibaculum sp.]MDP3328026.1 alpha/beta fold hydrolase [Parvibaculum sp.]
MAKRREDIVPGLGEEAAETPNVLSPIVGISREDVLSAIGSIVGGAARQPFTFMQHIGSFGRNVVDIVGGGAKFAPQPKDRRFVDSAWQKSPVYRRLMQGWLAFQTEVHGFIKSLDLDPVEHGRAMLVADIMIDAVAPTNTFVGNPSAVKLALDTGGTSLVQGFRNAIDDLRNNHGMPSQVDKSPFKVGENIATTEGSVVYRTEMLELLQYTPQSGEVHAIPLLFVPPQINKYYVLDLTPEKSMSRYLTTQGFQVFVVSWRNPGPEHRDWGLAEYVAALVDVIGVVCSITNSEKVNISGGCSGGITTATLLSYLAAKKDKRINSVTFWVCVLDPRMEDSDVGVLVTKRGIEMARKRSAKKGVLAGSDLSRVFAWLRPNDLIWNYVVNNYLHGQKPPAFDVLFWNNDSTNLTAALHSDYLSLYETQPFANPGKEQILGEPIDLGKVDIDAFIVGGVTDHITPWKACYRTTQMLGGRKEFVLSNSGHIQAILNPPGNPKAKYFVNDKLPSTADEWAAGASEVNGSWWERWAKWLGERSGEMQPASKKLGSRKYKPLDPAPGTYVLG